MKANTKHAPLCTALAAALAGFGTAAAAQEGEVAALRTPSSEVSGGIGVVDKDNQRFGQYNGLNEKGGYLLLDADVVRRDDETGTWLKFRGRNVGLDSRELRLEHNRQGDWGYFIDFSQTPRFNPYTVNTGLAGIGSTTQTRTNVVPGAGTDYDFKTERKNWTLGFDKAVARGLDFQVRLRNEEKDGLRQWGQGTFGTGWLFLAEPIDQTTRQIDATLSYNTERLQLTGGYYGTQFENHNNRVTVVGGIFASMALPPDNQSHQLHFAGGYSFTPTTRATFKLAHARLTQNDTFPDVSVTGRTDLGGLIETNQAQLGFTTRPLPKLSVLANLRYEDRNDQTPVFVYNPGQAAGATTDGTNEPRSVETTAGKLEASYALPAAFKVTGGVDYEEKKRNTFRVISVSQRERTEETTVRAELRRPVSETLTGAVGLAHSKRDGSDYLTSILNGGATGANLIAPLHTADRDRDQVRLSLNWMATDALSMQLRADEARDDYTTRGGSGLGPRKGRASFYSVDGAYHFSEAWQANAWASRSDNRAEQASCQGIPAGGPFACTGVGAVTGWASNVRNVQDSIGFGVNAKPRGDLDVGAEVQHSRMLDEFELSRIAGGSAVIGELPDIPTRVTSFKLFAKYAFARNSGVRLQYVHDRFSTDDWTWSSWTYSDGTRVRQESTQKVNFIGLAYYYQFQ